MGKLAAILEDEGLGLIAGFRMTPQLRRLKRKDPMGYLQARFGEGAVMTTKEMEKEGVHDAYEDWIMDALDAKDPDVVLISRDLAIHLPVWNK